jgi:hypothetical protein
MVSPSLITRAGLSEQGSDEMRGNFPQVIRFGVVLTALVVLGWVLTGQAARPDAVGIPTDWTHRHVIFSQPSTPEEFARVAGDPRFMQQWYRQRPVLVSNGESNDLPNPLLGESAGENPDLTRASGHDWSQDLGSGASVGAGNFPAKYSFRTSGAQCSNGTPPDYVVFATGLAGSGIQASIVAYDNLYSSCTGTVPSVYWAYDTGTGAKIETSPTISGDGTQVAFVQSLSNAGSVVILKWAASTSESVTSPLPLTAVSNASYPNCTAPCMTEVALENGLGGAVDDTTSSVFPDYTHDIIWVGGASGWLHKITGVFRGVPTEVKTGGFPVQLSTNSLSSPVYDFASGYVFVGDVGPSGGYFYQVNPNTAVVNTSARLDHSMGITAGPIVDSTNEKVYVFVSNDGSTACLPGSQPCTGVYQFSATGNLSSDTEVAVGTSSVSPSPMYEGAFDQGYTGSFTATGHLYVCGNTGGPPILYQIPITSGTMGAVVSGPVISNSNTWCSPVSDVPNPSATSGGNATGNEWIFASTKASGLGNNCVAGGCIMNFVDLQWIPSNVYAVGQEVIDTHFQIQVCSKAGTSKATAPAWKTVVGAITGDNNVNWINQGPAAAFYATWTANNNYLVNALIVDSNGNIELVTKAGKSGGTAPTWKKIANQNTADGGVTWRNLGAVATASQAAAGGTSGIIIDNVISAPAGGSQVYYSTQSNQTCGTSGTGGCAVQASQSALQ